MISCDGCDRRLALAEVNGGLVVERNGLVLCATCVATPPAGPAAPTCDECAERVDADALRRGVAGARRGRLLCARCLPRARRAEASRIDAGLVATAALAAIALPLAGWLAWWRLAPAPPVVAAAPSVLVAEHERAVAELRSQYDAERARGAEREAALVRDRDRARAEAAQARTESVERAAGDALDGELGRVDAAYRDALARELADGASVRAKMLALWRVAEIGDPDLAALVEPRLDDGDARVRARAAHVLGALGDKRRLAALVTRLDDPDADTRRAVERAAAALAGRPIAVGRAPEEAGRGSR